MGLARALSERGQGLVFPAADPAATIPAPQSRPCSLQRGMETKQLPASLPNPAGPGKAQIGVLPRITELPSVAVLRTHRTRWNTGVFSRFKLSRPLIRSYVIPATHGLSCLLSELGLREARGWQLTSRRQVPPLTSPLGDKSQLVLRDDLTGAEVRLLRCPWRLGRQRLLFWGSQRERLDSNCSRHCSGDLSGTRGLCVSTLSGSNIDKRKVEAIRHGRSEQQGAEENGKKKHEIKRLVFQIHT